MIIYTAKASRPGLKGFIRDMRPVWLLEELGEPYEMVYLDPSKKENREESYLALNPFGKVPTIKDGDFVLFESAAICNYIADKFGRFIPKAGTPARALHDQWVSAAISTIEPHTSRIFYCDNFLEKNEKTAYIRELAVTAVGNSLLGLDKVLSRSEVLVTDGFSVADILMTIVLRSLPSRELKTYPHIRAYIERNENRPAFKRALAKNGSY